MSEIKQPGRRRTRFRRPHSLQFVRDYLDKVIAGLPANSESRLPPIRSIASESGTSLRTVQQVFREYSEQGKIVSIVGCGSFAIGQKADNRGLNKDKLLRIAINFDIEHPNPDRTWTNDICNAVLRSGMHSQYDIVFASWPRDTNRREVEKKLRQFNGGILFPPITEFKFVLPVDLPVPLVHVSPPDVNSTSNFVDSDFYSISRKLGEVWGQLGKKRVLYGSRFPFKETKTSGRLSYFGLIAGLKNTNEDAPQVEWVCCDGTNTEHGAEAMQRYLDSGKPVPDAIFCNGDHIALGMREILTQRGISCPDDLSIASAGFTTKADPSMDLTRILHNSEAIADNLMTMLLKRIERGGEDSPGTLVPTHFIGGGTTTAKENEMLMGGKPESKP